MPYDTLRERVETRLGRLSRVARAADSLSKCIAEFGDQLECCGECFQELDDALGKLLAGDLYADCEPGRDGPLPVAIPLGSRD